MSRHGTNTSKVKNIIIDVGMHDGKDSFYYASRGFEVIAYEANPTLCSDVIEKVNAAGMRIDVRNRAISDTNGNLNFYVNRFNTTWSSLDPNLGNRKEGSDVIKVKSCKLDEELRELSGRIHFAKIDIEGYDQVALAQLMRLDEKPCYISVENGSEEMLEMLIINGYTSFKFSNQKFVPGQKIPAQSKHGNVVPYSFARSASGLWGEDIDGRWINVNETCKIIKALTAARSIANGNLFAEVVGWFDLHARHDKFVGVL